MIKKIIFFILLSRAVAYTQVTDLAKNDKNLANSALELAEVTTKTIESLGKAVNTLAETDKTMFELFNQLIDALTIDDSGFVMDSLEIDTTRYFLKIPQTCYSGTLKLVSVDSMKLKENNMISAEEARELGKKKRIEEIFNLIENNADFFKLTFQKLNQEEISLLEEKGFKVERKQFKGVDWECVVTW